MLSSQLVSRAVQGYVRSGFSTTGQTQLTCSSGRSMLRCLLYTLVLTDSPSSRTARAEPSRAEPSRVWPAAPAHIQDLRIPSNTDGHLLEGRYAQRPSEGQSGGVVRYLIQHRPRMKRISAERAQRTSIPGAGERWVGINMLRIGDVLMELERRPPSDESKTSMFSTHSPLSEWRLCFIVRNA